MSKKIARCLICNEEFDEDDLKNATCCPKCGSLGIQADPKDDTTIKINWHELRILSIWAENWARKCDNDDNAKMKCVLTINCIAKRIQKQYPEKTPLTLSGEIDDLKKSYQDIETNFDIKQNKIASEFNA